MNLRALMSNRRAQIGAALAVAVILLALMRRRSAGGDPPAASTISETQLGGDPNPAFEGPVTFADNGGYASALGTSVTESLGNVASALDLFSDQFAAQQEQLGGISTGLTQLGGQIATIGPAAVVPGTPSAAAAIVTPSLPPAAAPVGGPSAAQLQAAAAAAANAQAAAQAAAATAASKAQASKRPTGGAWDGSNVFRQDSGSRAGQWFYVFKRDGKSYRQYQDGSKPIPIS